MITYIIYFFTLLITFLVGAFVIDFPTMLFMLLVYLVGIGLTIVLNKSRKKVSCQIYSCLFIWGGLYMIASYYYMDTHGYQYLLAYDIYNAFHPNVESYLSMGNYCDALNKIWGEYNFFKRYQYGYYTYATTFAYLANAIKANFYIGQNLSVLFLYAFVGVLLYRMMLECNIENSYARKAGLFLSLVSIIFFYSFQTLRDIHILLIYLAVIYITLKQTFSAKALICIVLLCWLCCTIRLESGLFLFSSIPVYLMVSLKQSKNKVAILLISFVTFLITILYLVNNISSITRIIEANSEYYMDDISSGSGIIATLQRIPVIGDFLSVIYNFLQPVPCWAHLWVSSEAMKTLGGETYNIMTFPKSISAFFHCFVLTYLLVWLVFKKVRFRSREYLSVAFKYQMIIGGIFLFLQSAVIAQRRLMGYYCIFYILFVIIYLNTPSKQKLILNCCSILMFIGLQIFGFIYLA